MRKIICDRCGAEIHGDRIGYVAVTWRAKSDNSFMQASPYQDSDFCENCIKTILMVIDNDETPAPEEETEEPVEDPEEKPSVNVEKAAVKKPVDKGKVGALAQAGWNNVKIANEMNISTERVRQIMKELEGKK